MPKLASAWEEGVSAARWPVGPFGPFALPDLWSIFQACDYYLGGGFQHFLFSPLFGEDSHFD